MKLHRRRAASAPRIDGGAPERGSSVASRRSSWESGQTVVEFALVLPIVAALVVVVLQFGKIIYSYINLTHLANEGARYAAVNKFPGGSTSVSGFLCPKLGAAGKVVTVAFTAAAAGAPTAGDAVNVTVHGDYPLIPYWGGSTISVQSTASMRLEQPPSYGSGATTC
jgi:TadE-like protein